MDSNRGLLSRQTLLSDTAILIYLALFKLILHWLTSGGYGYFRDEFYYIAASQRLQFGYLEFPPMIALITALTRGLLGESLFALHFFPALAGALIVLLTGLMARELGGGRFAQIFAALAVIIAPAFLATNSLLTMDSFDQLWWVMAAYIVLRLLKQDNPKLWLLFGLVAGLGLMTKLTMLFFGSALVLGLLLTPGRKYLASKWLWLGGLIAFACVLPYIGWEFVNGWPSLEFWKAYASGKTYPVTPIEFLLQQIAQDRLHPVVAARPVGAGIEVGSVGDGGVPAVDLAGEHASEHAAGRAGRDRHVDRARPRHQDPLEAAPDQPHPGGALRAAGGVGAP